MTSRWVLNPNQVDKEIGFNPAWQVSLLHRGGMSAGATAGHSATVIKSVSDYLDEFINRIKAANK